MENLIFFDDDAQKRLSLGINIVADAVKITLGPAGRFALIRNAGDKIVVTKDGVSIAESIQLIDPIEDMGAQFLIESASKTAEDYGDGTTTSTVITQALINNSLNTKMNNLMLFKEEMNEALEFIIKELNDSAIINLDKASLYNTALTSSNKDIEIANIVSECVFNVGLDGVVEAKETSQEESTFETYSGFKLNKGYIDTDYITNKNNNSLEVNSLKNEIKVLIINGKLDQFSLISPVLSETHRNKHLLVVVAEDYSDEFLFNAKKNWSLNKNIICLKADEFGDRRAFSLQDLAIYLNNAEVYDLEDFSQEDFNLKLGEACYIKCTKDHTLFRKSTNSDNELELKDRISQINNLIKESRNEFDTKKLKVRLSQLNAGYSIIYVGGKTPSEIKEKFDRYEDTIGSCQAAFKYGIISGGGSALYNISHKNKITGKKGYDLVMKSIKEPFFQIMRNASRLECFNELEELKSIDKNFGVNALNGQFVNMIDSGIVDPLKVTESALRNSISIVNLILSTNVVIQNSFIKKN